MWNTASRLLELLSRLQSRGVHSAEELATEFQVTTRTIRRDIARLRDLGYPINTQRGDHGGYQLDEGATLPPILFTLEEAVACLQAMRPDNTGEATDYAQSALAKINAVLPARLSSQLAALTRFSKSLDGRIFPIEAHPVPAELIAQLATACRSGHQLVVSSSDRDGRTVERTLEPAQITHTMERWYLTAYYLEAGQWRLFRVDKFDAIRATERPNYPRPLPSEDMDDWVFQQLRGGWQQVSALVRVHAAADRVRHWIAPAWGTVEAESERSCLLRIGADNHTAVARWLLLLESDFTVLEPVELRTALSELAAQAAAYARAQ
ncbi:helix-turn-helix transcriptional regulator [Psychromicrobium lacuslunae]|uniref:helix-turn-helix transcriptional regulator n=1 Tax=Psychromicrobium lacuslunae TaxID=1618207 RepID=UPI0005D3B5E6|nr:YafY family protein [Psychromicrobium lacuslunae]